MLYARRSRYAFNLIAASDGKYNLATIFRPKDNQSAFVSALSSKNYFRWFLSLFFLFRVFKGREVEFTAFAMGRQFHDRTSKCFQP